MDVEVIRRKSHGENSDACCLAPERTDPEPDWQTMRPQLLAACAANLEAFALGASIGWAAPSLPELLKPPLELTKTQVSMVGSVFNLGGMLGAVSGGWFIDRLGRRKCILLVAPMYLVGFLLIALGLNFEMLIVGRILTGLAGGLTTMVSPVYVSEIAVPTYRGLLGSMFSLLLVSGVLFVYILGAFLSWWVIALISSVIPILGFILTIVFVPESPVYLLSQDDEFGAKQSLEGLRGRDCAVEFEGLCKVERRTESVKLKDLLARPVLKSTFLCLSLMFFQQMSGINAALYNLKSIFDAAGGSLDSSLQVIVIGSVQLLTTGAGSLVVDRLGRKILLCASGLVMGIAMTGLGTYFHLAERSPDIANNLGWLPLLSLMLFSIFFYVGFGPVVWTLMGEILPPGVKGVTSAIVAGFSWFLAFLTTFSYESMVGLFGQAGAFYFYGSFALVSVVHVVVFVPETTGKTLVEIQEYFA